MAANSRHGWEEEALPEGYFPGRPLPAHPVPCGPLDDHGHESPGGGAQCSPGIQDKGVKTPAHAGATVPIPPGFVLLLLELPLGQQGGVPQGVVGRHRAADGDIYCRWAIRVPAWNENVGRSGAVPKTAFHFTRVARVPNQFGQGMLEGHMTPLNVIFDAANHVVTINVQGGVAPGTGCALF